MELAKILIEQYGYSPQAAATTAEDLAALDESVLPIFRAWQEDRTESDATLFSGYSVDSLREHYGMTFFSALVTLDWIVKEPQSALQALRDGIKSSGNMSSP